MPKRTASMTKRIAANGQALHRAKERGMADAEVALREERRLLMEERKKRAAQALQPRPSALDRLVRTHHPEGKGKKARKDTHDAAATKKPKAQRSRAEKHEEKAAAIEAARHKTPKKPAK
jgi:hypothetical protein